MRAYFMNHLKHLPLVVLATLCAAGLPALAPTALAQEPLATPPPLQGAETPPPRVERRAPTPEPEVTAPAVATPSPPPPKVRKVKPQPTPPPDEPVAVVNGSPVYQPLFASAVADPVDRALVLLEYRHRGYVVPAGALDLALKNHTRTAFGDPTKLVDKLQELGASYDDYRAFVAEEVKIQAMLSIMTKGGRTDADRKQLRENWLVGLRKNANINKPKRA